MKVCQIEELTLTNIKMYDIACCDDEKQQNQYVFNSKNNKADYSLYKRYKLYEQGLDRLNQEVDLVNFTKSLRLLKTLLSSLMDDSERYMSKYQHQNCLKLNQCHICTNENNLFEENEIPKLLDSKFKIDKHKNLINQFFAKYTEEHLTMKDYKLLKGVY